MITKNQQIIFDPYSILPSYGENGVELFFKKGNLDVKIFYDSEIKDSDENVINFSFKHSCFHRFTSFPGISDSAIKFEQCDEISSLIEFKYSDYKLAWEKHFNNLFKFRHFRIFFTSANHYLEVICEDLEIKT